MATGKRLRRRQHVFEDSYVQGELWPPEAILGVKNEPPVCHAMRGNNPEVLETTTPLQPMILEHTGNSLRYGAFYTLTPP